jgi:CubicO group peptidase (beta-lactamase class C family)
LMYAVLAHCVETLSGGRWLGHILREWIWAPLGMGRTYFSLEEALAAPEDLATGYYWDEDAGEFGKIEPMGLHEITGAGAVITCVRDYALWVKSLLEEGGPLPKDVHAALRTPKMIIGPEPGLSDIPPQYAAGWIVGSYRGHRYFTHSGGMEAYGAEIYFFPDDKYGVVTLANTAVTSNAVGEILVGRLVDSKLAIPVEHRYSWTGK